MPIANKNADPSEIFQRTPVVVRDWRTKEYLADFVSLRSCANTLGIKTSTAWNCVRNKGSNKTNNLGKRITIRLKPV